MADLININDLANEITASFSDWCKEVDDNIEKAADIVSKEVLNDIKEDSPKDTGTYKKGWSRKKVKQTYVIHNTKKPHLTYILQDGFTNRKGKRIAGVEHITKNADRGILRFEQYVDDILGGFRF